MSGDKRVRRRLGDVPAKVDEVDMFPSPVDSGASWNCQEEVRWDSFDLALGSTGGDSSGVSEKRR